MQLEKQALEAAKQALIGHGDECKEVNDALTLIDQALAKQSAQLAVPDFIGPNEGDDPQYIQGWNDCRALMLSWRNK